MSKAYYWSANEEVLSWECSTSKTHSHVLEKVDLQKVELLKDTSEQITAVANVLINSSLVTYGRLQKPIN